MKKAEQLVVTSRTNLQKEMRAIRQEKCLRQTDVAKRMKCSSSNICQFELKPKKRGTNVKIFLRYAKALGFKNVSFNL